MALPDYLAGLWGFCRQCERWRHSESWYPDGSDAPVCPVCGGLPALIERRDGDRTYLDLMLEVAMGPVGNRDPHWWDRAR